MSLLLKPHRMTVYAPDPVLVAGGTGVGISQVGGQTVFGQITPITSTAAYQDYGMELDRPHLLMVDESDAVHFKVWGRVVKVPGGRKFTVRATPMIWDAESTTSCAVVMLEEVMDA